MKALLIAMILVLASACAETPLPRLAPVPDPYDPAGQAADIPYRPVMAGTASPRVGGDR
jgi:hypothetical protein